MTNVRSLVMNSEEWTHKPAQTIGPITDVYLHREVHPDEQAAIPLTKAQHGGAHTSADTPLPKADEVHNGEFHEEDRWMYT